MSVRIGAGKSLSNGTKVNESRVMIGYIKHQTKKANFQRFGGVG